MGQVIPIQPPPNEMIQCDICHRHFDKAVGVAIHKGKMHRPAVDNPDAVVDANANTKRPSKRRMLPFVVKTENQMVK